MCQQNVKCSLDDLSVKNIACRDDLSFLETKYVYKRSHILMLLLISKGRLPTFSNNWVPYVLFQYGKWKIFLFANTKIMSYTMTVYYSCLLKINILPCLNWNKTKKSYWIPLQGNKNNLVHILGLFVMSYIIRCLLLSRFFWCVLIWYYLHMHKVI